MDNTDIKILVEHLRRLEEGNVGTAVGSGLGALAGSALGPLGTAAGAAAGGWLGNKIGDSPVGDALGHIFNTGTKSSVAADTANIKSSVSPGADKSVSPGAAPSNSMASDQKFFTSNPDGSTSEVTPPVGGWGSNRDAINPTTGEKMDKYGNSHGDYTKQDIIAISAGYGGKPSRGGLEAELQKLEDARGADEKVVDAWTWKNSVLALFEGERTQHDTIRGTTNGRWTDVSGMAKMGANEFVALYKSLGYSEYQGDNEIRVKGPLGDLYGAIHEMKRGGKSIIICELYQFFTFESSKGKGLHIYTIYFLGPKEDWQSGGKEELLKLSNSVKLSSSVKPLALPNVQEQIRHLQNTLDYLEKKK